MVTSARTHANLERLREAWHSEQGRRQFERQYPYATVALSVVSLRRRHGLTQQSLAEAIGSTQSVISRLESGQHPVEIRLLQKIADAVGEPWSIRFGTEQELAREPTEVRTGIEGERYEAKASEERDELLDAFNSANTSGDFDQARSISDEMRLEPSTPRRCLAIALSAYNSQAQDEAIAWAAKAMAGLLPDSSRETAALVQASALLKSERAKEAIAILVATPTRLLGWRVPATLADAYMQLGANTKAVREARRALDHANGAPEARYTAARAAWHAGRPWEGLDHIAVYRASEPDDVAGQMLHGSILGFLAGGNDNQGAYEEALGLFRRASRSRDCEALRLMAMTQARLRRPEEALRTATRYVAMRGHRSARHRRRAMRTVVEPILERAADSGADEVRHLCDLAEQAIGKSAMIRRWRARAAAIDGDVAGTRELLGIEADDRPKTSVADSLLVGIAYYSSGQHADAVRIFEPHEAALPETWLVRYAQSAVAIGDDARAKSVLTRVADGDGDVADVARVALALVEANERKATMMALTRLATTEVRWFAPREDGPAPAKSDWEGRHPALSPVLETMTRVLAN